MQIYNFEDLEIWQKARELCRKVQIITKETSLKHDYHLREQIRASVGSVMDNIAEGFERGGNKEFIQFLYIAKGSLGETRSQLYRCYDNGYISDDIFTMYVSETKVLSAMIFRLIEYLKNSEMKGYKFK
ncbi:four helix bundle protein [Raineya sp.]